MHRCRARPASGTAVLLKPPFENLLVDANHMYEGALADMENGLRKHLGVARVPV